MERKKRAASLVAVSLLCLAGTAHGQGVNRLWLGTGGAGGFDGVYGDPAAWLDGDVLGVPTADDTVIFNSGSLVEFTLDNAASRMWIPGGSVVIDLAGHTMELLFVDPLESTVVVGESVGGLQVVNGTLVAAGRVSVGNPGLGMLVANGKGTMLLVNDLDIGPGDGLGFLEVGDGAVVDSEFLRIRNGDGTLSGSATVVTTLGLRVANVRPEVGTLIMRDGVQVSASNTRVGQEGFGTMIVRGAGTVLTTSSLFMGLEGLIPPPDEMDELIIADGAHVQATGHCTVETGRITVQGPGALLSTPSLRLDNNFLFQGGKLDLSGGGCVDVGTIESGAFAPNTPVKVTFLSHEDYSQEAAIVAADLASELVIEVAPLEYLDQRGEVHRLVQAGQIILTDLALPPLVIDEHFWRVLTESDRPDQVLTIQVGPTGDVDLDGTVGIIDLLRVLSDWGPCVQGGCLADLDIDGAIGVTDLLGVLDDWD